MLKSSGEQDMTYRSLGDTQEEARGNQPAPVVDQRSAGYRGVVSKNVRIRPQMSDIPETTAQIIIHALM